MVLTVHLVIFLCGLASAISRVTAEENTLKTAEEVVCEHFLDPKELVTRVHVPFASDARRKRQTNQLRIQLHYDDSVNTELDSTDRTRLQDTVMPTVEEFFESTLSAVVPAAGPLLLERDCVDGIIYLTEDQECFSQCESTTTCGRSVVPEGHLRRCIQCNENQPPNCETLGQDGDGVNNTDLIIYVSADPNSPCGAASSTLAFAGACQLESELDRPFAGHINFCPQQFPEFSDELNIVVAKHELMHALAFSSGLYPYFRDENGEPRTPRDQFGRPVGQDGLRTPSVNTTTPVTYPDWQTRLGTIDHNVTLLVTPAVMAHAQSHYNCPSLEGVELENQGGSGTAISHWEKRVLENEGMTGVLSTNARFSNFTLALLQDTGWYEVDFSMAENLQWGREAGCRFAHGSCGEWIETRLTETSGISIDPFCNVVTFDEGSSQIFPTILGCSSDRDYVSFCNGRIYPEGSVPPSEYLYFNSGTNFDATEAPRAAGTSEVHDFCPYQSLLESMQCSNSVNQPPDNVDAETYGTGSRCFVFGQPWSRTVGASQTTSDSFYGGGCYQYSCTQNGVIVQVLENSFLCACEGEEDNLASCTDGEPNQCYGRVTTAEVLPVLVQFTSTAIAVSEGSQSALVSLELASGSAEVPTGGLTVSIATTSEGGTATAGADYIPFAGSVVFSAGGGPGTVRSVSITIIDDAMVEGTTDEVFFVSAMESASFAQFVGSNTATVSISDNDVDDDGDCSSLHFISDSPTLTYNEDTSTYALNFEFTSDNSGEIFSCFLRDSERSCPPVVTLTACDQVQNVTFTSLDPGVWYIVGVRCSSGRIQRSISRSVVTPEQIDSCVPQLINDGISFVNYTSDGNATTCFMWSSSGSPTGFWCSIDNGEDFPCESPFCAVLTPDQHTITVSPQGCAGDVIRLRRRVEVPAEGCALSFSLT